MSHKGVIDPNARVLYISANNKAGPLDYQNGHGHYTSQHPCKSKLWIWRACNRLPETWHTHGRGPEYLVPRREHLPFNKWWRDMDHTLGLEQTRGLHQEVLHLQQ